MMSSGPVRRVSCQDIQLVQNLIERCLQLYMNQKEVVQTLLVQAKIEPDFTELVWQKLEEQNQDFFKAYYLRLMLKYQITEFNKLLEQQVQFMHQVYSTGAAPMPTGNGTHIPRTSHNLVSYPENHGLAVKPEKIQHPAGPSSTNAFMNDGASLHATMPSAVGMSAHVNRIDVPANVISSQNSDTVLMQGINGGIIKTENGYTRVSPYTFGAESNVLAPRSAIGDMSVASFSSVESTSQPLNEPLLDADNSSFGFLGQIPRNFSLSDLTADFSQSSDILESYVRSPFLATDADHFLDACERGEQGERISYSRFCGHISVGEYLYSFLKRCIFPQVTGPVRRLDPISEGLSYEAFGNK